VHISEGDVSSLRETWTLQWQREPTAEELRGAVRQLLNEQLLALEAHTMRLDENDTVVRRRLAQKLNFIIQSNTLQPNGASSMATTPILASFAPSARVIHAGLFSLVNHKDPTAARAEA
jgi:hypothetical protein